MSLLEKNLAAMERESPDSPLARQLRSTGIPADFLPTPGTDGTPTFFRLSDSGGQKQIHWLGQTSMPAASAPHMVKSLDAVSSGQNGLGLSIGTGFEWAAFLRRIPRAQLLYVYEPDVAQLRMALEICDLAEPLAARRIVLLAGAPDDAARQLCDFLARNIGFEPPAVLHPLPSIPPDRRNQFLAAGELIVRHAILERQLLLSALHEQLTAALAQGSLRVAHQSLGMLLTPRHRLERPLHAAPFAAPPLYLDRHDTAGLALRLQVLATHAKAGLVKIQSDLFRAQLAHTPAEIPIETWIPPLVGAGFWDKLPAPGSLVPHDRIIVHHAYHAQMLKDSGIPEKQIEIRLLQISDRNSQISDPPAESGLKSRDSRIGLLADLSPTDPASLGIQLPTHLAVFAAARELVIAEHLAVHPGMAADILRRALARAGIDPKIEDPALKTPMLRVIRDILIPALPLLTLAVNLAKEGLPLLLIGDWTGLQLPVPTHAEIVDFERGAADGAGVMLHFDPCGRVSPVVWRRAALGAALVHAAHPTDRAAGSIRDYVESDKSFLPAQNFIAALKAGLRDPARLAQIWLQIKG